MSQPPVSAPPPATPSSPAPAPAPQRFWWNWLTVVGLGGAALAFVTGGTLFLVDLWSPSSSVYMSLLTLAVTPGLICGGLGLAVLGMLLQAWSVKRGRARSFLWFDVQRQRRLWPAWMAAILVFLVASAYGGYRSFEFVEGKEFCGEVCHKVMHPEFMAHSNSPHSRVACITCHAGPGIEHQIKVKIRGIHQLVAVTTGEYNRPIATPLKHLRPAKDICEQCHWPQKFIGMVVQDHTYFLSDEQNTARHLRLLVHVGGGQLDTDKPANPQPAIHWHVSGPSKVEFVATDEHRQDIKWVKVSDSQGHQVTYRSDDLKESEAELMTKYEARKMDCIDCHNRAVHVFNPPDRLLNQALLTGTLDPSLPYLKKQGLELLTAEYATQADARAAIATKLSAYYQKEYPALLASKKAAIDRAATTLGDLYTNNIFPTMKADWKAHADNIGHTFAKGCFRCHNDSLKDSEGRTISHACNTCHDFVGQGEGATTPTTTAPQDFIHPGDVDESLWKAAACTDCHTGAGAGM